MTTATKKPKERLTLHDSTELLLQFRTAVEDHIDEIELNGGALPDWMATLFDEITLARAQKADAIALVLDELEGSESSAKATKDRAARRQRVWGNAIAGLKAYVLREIAALGEDRIRGTSCVLRVQRNGQASVELTAPPDTHNDLLLGLFDMEDDRQYRAASPSTVAIENPHPLARFITVQRVATLDKKALGAAYEARQAELEAEAAHITARDIDAVGEGRMAEAMAQGMSRADAVEGMLAEMRATYIAHYLGLEFPGVRCVRGSHLRVD